MVLATATGTQQRKCHQDFLTDTPAGRTRWRSALGTIRQAAARLLEFDALPESLLRPAIGLLKTGNIRCDELMMRHALEMLGRLTDDVDALIEVELDEESRAMIADLTDDVLGEPVEETAETSADGASEVS